AAVQGVDAVMVGLGDLSASMGVETADAACFEAVDAVVAAGKAASRPVIIAGLRDAAACGKMVAHGASPFFIPGTDISYLLDGAGRQIANFHAVFGGTPA